MQQTLFKPNLELHTPIKVFKQNWQKLFPIERNKGHYE